MNNSESFILERKGIELKEVQLKMLASSWGKSSIDETVVGSGLQKEAYSEWVREKGAGDDSRAGMA